MRLAATSENEALLDRSVRHLLLLERVKARIAARAIGRLNRSLYPRLASVIEERLRSVAGRGMRLSPSDAALIAALLGEVDAMIETESAPVAERLASDLEAVAEDEHDFAAGLLLLVTGRRLRAVALDASERRAIVRERPFDGGTLGEHVAAADASVARAARRVVQDVVVGSEPIEMVRRRVVGSKEARGTDGIAESHRRAIDNVARSAVSHVSTHASEEAAETVSRRDGAPRRAKPTDRTATWPPKAKAKGKPAEAPASVAPKLAEKAKGKARPQRREKLAPGEVDATPEMLFPVEQSGPIADEPIPLLGVMWVATLDSRTCLRCMNLDGRVFAVNVGPRPPLHSSCRCGTTPIIRGSPKPTSPRFAEWLARQPSDVQDDALGATRGALYRRGGLAVGDFVNNRGKVMTLRALRRKEKDAFARAGVRLDKNGRRVRE